MSDETVVVVVVAIAVLLIVVAVLAPWRSPRRDALDEEDYYALMAGEEPPPLGALGEPVDSAGSREDATEGEAREH